MSNTKRPLPKGDNKPQGLSVIVRVRQYIEREKAFVHNDVNYYSISPDNTSILLDGKQYTLDQILRPELTQADVFEITGKKVVDSCLKGYTATVMAYGQTGSGKTYTMTGGSNDARGILPRSLEYLFERLEETDTPFSVNCSYLEIYNEQVRDLLNHIQSDEDGSTKPSQHNPRGVRSPGPGMSTGALGSARKHDPNNLKIISQGVDDSTVLGLSHHPVLTANDALQLLDKGFDSRTTASTRMNSESSRSHSVFTIYLAFQQPGSGQMRQCKLHFVDLAGSESAKKTGAEGQTLTEGNNINRSLSCLSKMIKTLADNYAKGKTEQFSVRESKLTFLLRKSFGQGNPLCLIANISPSSDNVMETSSTLAFARNARALPNVVEISKDVVDPYLAQQLQQQQLTLQQHHHHDDQTDYNKLVAVYGSEAALTAQLRHFHNISTLWKRQRMNPSSSTHSNQTDQHLVQLSRCTQ